METWRTIWRNGIAPQFTAAALENLRTALLTDDDRLIQGATCSPPPLECVLAFPVEAACVLGYGEWESGRTVGQVQERFATLCAQVDRLIEESAGVRHFLNWYDDTPRDEMRRLLLAEVNRELARRNPNRSNDESSNRSEEPTRGRTDRPCDEQSEHEGSHSRTRGAVVYSS